MKTIHNISRLKINESKPCKSLEQQIAGILAGQGTLPSGEKVQIFTQRSEGVIPATDITTDKWEVAAEGLEKVKPTFTLYKVQDSTKTEKSAENSAE